MFITNTIQECLYGLAGWRNYYNPAVIPNFTDTSLNDSSSGLYFQDFHPLLDLEVIKNTIPEDQDLETYLKDKTKSAIGKIVNAVFIEKKLNESTKSIFEDLPLFTGVAPYRSKIMNESRFVGFEFEFKDYENLVMMINKVGLQTSGVEALDLYVYHSSQPTPIDTIAITTTAANGFNWTTPTDKVIQYAKDNHDIGGTWYLGYYESDLNGEALRKDFNFQTGPCYTCNKNDSNNFRTRSKYVGMHPFSVSSANLPAQGTMWDVTLNQYDYNTNFGLNMQLTVKCDISDFICRQKALFTQLIQAGVAVEIIDQIRFSKRLNYLESIGQNYVIRELEGDTATHNIGLFKQKDRLVKAINFDLSDMDTPCMPCKNKKGIINTAI